MWIAAFLLAAAPQTVVSEAPTAQSITLYGELAFIMEARTVDLPAGKSTIVFEGVNDQMVPQTAVLQSFEGMMIERNFDAGVLSPSSFYKSALGSDITLMRTNETTGARVATTAQVVGAQNGLVVKTDNGIEALSCSGFPEGVSLPEAPDDLVTRPQLSIDVTSQTAGPHEVSIGYLATGFSWSTDYVVTLNGDGSAKLFGWLTMDNETNGQFTEANMQVVAGAVQVLPETQSPDGNVPLWSAICWPSQTTKGPFSFDKPQGFSGGVRYEKRMRSMAVPAPMASMEMDDAVMVTGSRLSREENFGDYKLYRPPSAVTLNPYQTKQLAFVDKADVKVSTRYVFDLYPEYMDDEEVNAQLEYHIDNSRDGGLSKALPRGTMRFFQSRTEGPPLFMAEGSVGDMAIDLPVEIGTRDTPAVWAETKRTVIRDRIIKRLTGNSQDIAAKLETRVFNTMAEAVSVEVSFMGWQRSGTVQTLQQEPDGRLPDKPYPTWRVEVPAYGDVLLEWQVRTQQ